jgi:transcriptional regulator with XRE-family HTH domain
MDIADTFKAERKRQHLSVEEVARKAGLSYRTVWNIEKGGSVPRGKSVRAIAEALGLDLADLPQAEGAA